MKPMNTASLQQAGKGAADLLRFFLMRPKADGDCKELLERGERELLDIGIGRGEVPYLLTHKR